MPKILTSILLVVISTFTALAVVPTGAPQPETPKIAEASADAENQIQSFRVSKYFLS